MLIIAYVPVLVAILGCLAYALSTNAKAVELGRIAFFTGLFWFLASVAQHVVKVG